MAENPGRPIPTFTKPFPHHWWYDPRQTTVNNSPTPSYPNSPTGSLSSTPDTKGPIPLPSAEEWNKWRRDSLKNFYHLDDFATPE